MSSARRRTSRLREEIVDAGELGGVSNKPPLSMRHEGD